MNSSRVIVQTQPDSKNENTSRANINLLSPNTCMPKHASLRRVEIFLSAFIYRNFSKQPLSYQIVDRCEIRLRRRWRSSRSHTSFLVFYLTHAEHGLNKNYACLANLLRLCKFHCSLASGTSKSLSPCGSIPLPDRVLADFC